jgi:hypothetical protein
MVAPLMPKATAMWLIENTALTFKQIAEFCEMHELEIKGMADGEVASGLQGVNPVTLGQLSYDEIDRCSKDSSASLRISKSAEDYSNRGGRGAKYTPVARRRDKPDAIYWLIKNCPNIPDSAIVKLIGTTKKTINSIKNREHWNMKNLRPRDPVLLGICNQAELNNILDKYKVNREDSEAES